MRSQLLPRPPLAATTARAVPTARPTAARRAAPARRRRAAPAAARATFSPGEREAAPRSPATETAAGRLASATQQRGRPHPHPPTPSPPPGAPAGLTPELKVALDKFTTDNAVVLFMKGNRDFPQCGFSNTAVQILNSLGAAYETVNILEDDALRAGLKEYSAWPTFPQLYVGGEFLGGCDVMIAAYQSGELVEAVEAAAAE